MPLSMALFAANVPIVFAPFTFADRSFDALVTVEAAARVLPASSSMNWTWMFSLENQPAIRGRSSVPVAFFRIRQRRSCCKLCFFSVLISSYPSRHDGMNFKFLDRLAFLTLDVFARITHAFAFVRFRRIK